MLGEHSLCTRDCGGRELGGRECPALKELTAELPHLTAGVWENASPEGVSGSLALPSVVPNDSVSIPWKLVRNAQSQPPTSPH